MRLRNLFYCIFYCTLILRIKTKFQPERLQLRHFRRPLCLQHLTQTLARQPCSNQNYLDKRRVNRVVGSLKSAALKRY